MIAQQKGDAGKAMAGAARTIEAVYQLPLLAHAAMEPMNCTVHVRSDGCDVWVGTQVATRARATASPSPACHWRRSTIHNHLLGGGFGRRLDVDGITRAVQIAQTSQFPQ